jgi:hypothetical protein
MAEVAIKKAAPRMAEGLRAEEAKEIVLKNGKAEKLKDYRRFGRFLLRM